MKLHDTIAAIATPIGTGGIAILRISGSDATTIAARVLTPFHQKPLSQWESHKLTLCRVHQTDQPGAVLDQALAVIMRAPHSYTGEDVVEIQCHGGFLAADGILKQLLLAGARLAEGGEFTRRAFLNGKTGLDEAEAVMDVIDARSSLGLANAALSLNGALSKEIDRLREQVMALTSHISATADYPEEVDPPTREELSRDLATTEEGMLRLLATFETGRMLREGILTVIVGRPNVGKSSLLNAMAGYDRAIVTDIPGTTRDIIEESVHLGGMALRLMDTAGLRHGTDEVERIGIDRAHQQLQEADLCLFVLDNSCGITAEDMEIAARLQGRTVLVLLNKTDQARRITADDVAKQLGFDPAGVLETAIPRGGDACGIADLESAIADLFLRGRMDAGRVYLSNARQRDALQKALDALRRVQEANLQDLPYDLLYVDLEDTLSALGEITGQTVQEEIIDQVFSRFCVGK